MVHCTASSGIVTLLKNSSCGYCISDPQGISPCAKRSSHRKLPALYTRLNTRPRAQPPRGVSSKGAERFHENRYLIKYRSMTTGRPRSQNSCACPRPTNSLRLAARSLNIQILVIRSVDSSKKLLRFDHYDHHLTVLKNRVRWLLALGFRMRF